MKTKEAIEFLEHDIKLFPHEAKSLPACLEIHKCAERIEEVIKLLKCGEKHKQMWKDFHYGLAHVNIGSYRNPFDDRKMADIDCINEIVRDVKQKYFPKPSKNFTEKVMEKIKKGDK